jgi:hypothetical protein
MHPTLRPLVRFETHLRLIPIMLTSQSAIVSSWFKSVLGSGVIRDVARRVSL